MQDKSFKSSTNFARDDSPKVDEIFWTTILPFEAQKSTGWHGLAWLLEKGGMA